MKFLPKRCEMHGIFKCNGIDYGSSTSWKSGVLVVNWDGNHNSWRISLSLGNTCNNKPSYMFRLDPNMIRKIICKAQLVLELNDSGKSSIHFKLTTPATTDKLKSMQELHSLLQDIKSGKAAPEVTMGLKYVNSSPVKAATEQQFTNMKENKKSDSDTNWLHEDCDDESKENLRGPVNISEKFLQRGQEKSRECLQSLATGGFYGSPSQNSLFNSFGTADKTGSSTPVQDRPFGVFSVNSSVKRTPGLMPDPTPSKKLRLSDAAPTYSWTKSKSSQPSLQGFSNLGNTCYMNAILQALFGLDTFASDLLVNNRKINKQMSQQSLYFSLAKLLHSRRRNASDFVRRDLLRAVKTSISTTVRRFSGYQQHDAHEFLIQVIDQLKEEVQKVCNATPSPNREDSQDFFNPAVINFEFEVTHSISCLACDEVVTKREQFNDLSLDMPKRRELLNPRSIQHALELFFKNEKIEYTCEKCGSNQSEVTHTLTKLPRVLILHLKRYNYDVNASRNTKMAESIRIPRYLTLQSHCSEQTQPPHPTYWPPPINSPQKLLIDSEDEKDVISRRRLDYNSGFHFKTKTSQDSENERLNDLNKTNPAEHNSEEKDEGSIKPIVLDQEMDPDLARVLDMSLKEHTLRQEKLDVTGEDEFERAMELSRQNNVNSTHTVSEVGVFDEKSLNELSEEEQLRLAIEQSLRESEVYYDNMMDQTETEQEQYEDCSLQHDNFEECRPIIETTNQNIEIPQNPEGTQCEESPKNKESNLDSNISQSNQKTETHNECCQITDSDLSRLKMHKSETRELFYKETEENTFLEDDKEQISDFTHDLNVGKKMDECPKSDKTESKCRTSILKEKDVGNSSDFDLLCNEADNGWMCLENKENKLPNQNESKTVSPSGGKDTAVDDATDDSDLEKNLSVVDNEEGELPYSYRLVSIVNHIGSTSVAGHYICDVHDIKKNGWFSFDDSHVSTISATDVYTKREKCGYIFFYISKEIFEDIKNHYATMKKPKEN